VVRDDFKQVVHASWMERPKRGNSWENLNGKLGKCQNSIQVWVKKKVQGNEELIRTKTHELENIQASEGRPNYNREKTLKEEIHNLMEQDEIKWKQRANEDWLRGGDCNIKFFHASATQKKR
jgi:hypothetical protein